MLDEPHDPSDEMTIPSRQTLTERVDEPLPEKVEKPQESASRPPEQSSRASRLEGLREKMNRDAPWALQQYLQGQIDLDKEIATRFPAMPVMSQIHLRSYGGKVKRGLATIATQDGAAALLVDVDSSTREVEFTFQLTSMIGFKFVPSKLSDMDRTHWMDTMRRSQTERRAGDIAFLWGAGRWESDYLICAARKHFTNIYAFSPHHIECATRLTAEVTNKLLDWLDGYWKPAEEDLSNAPKLSTW